MSDMDRRTVLRTLASASAAALFTWTGTEAIEASLSARAAQQAATAAGTSYQPQFFTEHEWTTVAVLVDLIIPRDERSGSATDAGVPEFIDFMMTDQPNRQVAMRGGLAWLDQECQARFDLSFAACADDQRRAVLDDVSWPDRARPEMSHGVRFFATFRDLTASGFWTSRIGIEDLGYQGNTVVPEWNGCPDEALRKLGLIPGSE